MSEPLIVTVPTGGNHVSYDKENHRYIYQMDTGSLIGEALAERVSFVMDKLPKDEPTPEDIFFLPNFKKYNEAVILENQARVFYVALERGTPYDKVLEKLRFAEEMVYQRKLFPV